jgi:hypothetical protein
MIHLNPSPLSGVDWQERQWTFGPRLTIYPSRYGTQAGSTSASIDFEATVESEVAGWNHSVGVSLGGDNWIYSSVACSFMLVVQGY